MSSKIQLHELGDFLELPLNAVLATYLPDGEALLSPVWFEWRDGSFHIITYKDVKYRNLKRDPRASILVFENGGINRGIEVRGEVQLDTGNIDEILQRIVKRYLRAEDRDRYAQLLEGVELAHIRLEPGKLRVWDHADDEMYPVGGEQDVKIMKAIRVHKYGGPDELKYERAPRPVPQAGEVLVRVLASGVNPVDWKMRQGLVQAFFSLQFPYIPGGDLAGIVEEVGPGVTGFQKGQKVYGYTAINGKQGSYAEYTTVPASSLALMPAALSFLDAASIPTGAATAWQGLFDYGKLQAGQRVLVLGAAGGVGSFVVQLAHLKGAYVLATASSENQDYVRSLGADEVIDYTKVPPEEITGSITDAVDLIFDAVGGKTAEQSVRVLRRGGTLVSAVSQPAPELMEEHGTQGIFFLATITSEILQAIAALIDEGSVQTPRTTVFPLQEVRQAHELSAKAHGGGRIVLQIADEHALSRDVEQE